MSSLAAWITEQFDRRLNWNDVEWIKQRWRGKLVMTGVLSANDARHAVECGADAIVAPNHGGRQLDGAPSTISVLEEIAAAIGNTCKVRKDGNVRSGQCGGQGAEADPARIGRAMVPCGMRSIAESTHGCCIRCNKQPGSRRAILEPGSVSGHIPPRCRHFGFQLSLTCAMARQTFGLGHRDAAKARAKPSPAGQTVSTDRTKVRSDVADGNEGGGIMHRNARRDGDHATFECDAA